MLLEIYKIYNFLFYHYSYNSQHKMNNSTLTYCLPTKMHEKCNQNTRPLFSLLATPGAGIVWRIPSNRRLTENTARYPYVHRCDVTAAIGAQILSCGPLPFSTLRSRVSETTAWLTFSGLISGVRSFRYSIYIYST